jgi:hypothetical protein
MGAAKVSDEPFVVFDGAGAPIGVEPEGGQRVPFPECLKEGGGGDIGQDVGVHHPEGLVIKKPAGMREYAAGTEDFGFE